ncbi:hypothetical protein ITP53_51470 [Nonomuraea sp. K274]|uniref:Uncharacterized protein n=1 Tax=Nonomuraea cypriaca TaxID=1187855 RepID=A0A931AJ41_9ACTN|nr:hypothetical protein [Nonomuraea cypriaca]MBF8193962.1 hypothetical protein [Nonomuraea cypriaca]
MARRRATAVSAVVLALGLTSAGVTPFIVQSASASVGAYDPIEGCEAGQTCEETTPQTTVTITTTLGTTPTPEPEEEQPETTITKTVTASPTKKSSTPKPTKTVTKAPETSAAATPTQNIQPLPTQSVEVPPSTPPTSQEPDISLPAVASETPPPATPTQTQQASSEEVPLELRNAAPEFDQQELTQKLSIPALVLVLLALFAVLIFEGRLRRMAHAAAVRKAGPQMGGRPDMPPPGGGYPAGPGYAAAGFAAPAYPGGTAYAPIISFVPVQTYPSGQTQYGAVYQDPGQAYPHQGYAPEPAPQPEPVVLHPDEFDSYSEPPEPREEARERDPFEPVIPPAAPPSDIPPGGASPYDGGVEQPLGPASAAETGDSEPWQQRPSLFDPPPRQGHEPMSAEGHEPTPPQGYEPPPYLPADEDVTAVQQQVTEEQPEPAKEKRGRRRKK